jgi:ribonuclease HI
MTDASDRVGRTEEGTDSTRVEMAALLEVLVGANVKENLIVMVDNQSILREISRWVGEGGRTFLVLSANPDILRMIIERLRMRITHGTATFLCKVKSHRGEPLNEAVDDLADLGRAIDVYYESRIDPEQAGGRREEIHGIFYSSR